MKFPLSPALPSLTIRGKLTLAALAPLCVILVLVAFAASYLINARIVGQTQEFLRNDLSAAREVLDHEKGQVRDIVRFTAQAGVTRNALISGRVADLFQELHAIRQREGLDLLTLTDADGHVLARANHNEPGREDDESFPFLLDALLGVEYSGPTLFSAAELQRESESLARRAVLAVTPPPPPDKPAYELRGLLLICAMPVTDDGGTILGCLYGGILLNNNLALVDRIRDIVYGQETFEGIDTGSATIFLTETRATTTVRLKNGDRAIGTRVSPAVAEAVLQRHQSWLDRAKVVDDWYLTAYEPIFDERGIAIGALYVGLLEKPFNALKAKAAFSLMALLVLGGGLGYLIARLISKRISRPLLQLDRVAQQVAEGERNINLAPTTHDEIGHLTLTFNRMTQSLKEREEDLNRLNRELEGKVAKRTAQLERKSLELIRAQEELLRSEKLAAIGSLASGVAHEINNPAAIVRGNVEILLMELPPGSAGREEAEEILKQTERISLITQNMLTFAREQALQPEKIDINQLLQEILEQIGHQVSFGHVKVERRLTNDLPLLLADRERLRQVFTNIILNALQAMAGQGTLSVVSLASARQVIVSIIDSGPGMEAEVREKIFNPFFTTKQNGTGLGLSISYGIVKAHQGRIEVESKPGHTVFHIHLPLSSDFSD